MATPKLTAAPTTMSSERRAMPWGGRVLAGVISVRAFQGAILSTAPALPEMPKRGRMLLGGRSRGNFKPLAGRAQVNCRSLEATRGDGQAAERADIIVRGRTMSRWLLRAALIAAMASAGIGGADAQSGSSTPYSSIPTPPGSIPIIGGAPVPDDVAHLLYAIATNDAIGAHGLLAAHTSPDESDEYGRTALIYAVMFDNVPIAQALISYGATLNIHDKLGKTALHWAAQRGSIDMLRVLLAANATVDAQNQQGLTPLMIAATVGRADLVRLLLQYHADPLKRDYTGRDAIDWSESHAAIAQTLKVAAAR
jgi:uncharacterized protein